MIQDFLQSPEAQYYLGIFAFLWALTILVAAIVGLKFPSVLGVFLGFFVVLVINGATIIYFFNSIGLTYPIGVGLFFLVALFNARTLAYLALVALIVALRRGRANEDTKFFRMEPSLKSRSEGGSMTNGD